MSLVNLNYRCKISFVVLRYTSYNKTFFNNSLQRKISSTGIVRVSDLEYTWCQMLESIRKWLILSLESLSLSKCSASFIVLSLQRKILVFDMKTFYWLKCLLILFLFSNQKLWMICLYSRIFLFTYNPSTEDSVSNFASCLLQGERNITDSTL